MSVLNNGWRGVRAGVPVLLGYVPVAMAYGIAAKGVGLSFWETVLISVFVYAGASQFFILAAIKLGTPLPGIVAMVSLLNARHLLYGPLIAKWLPHTLHKRLQAAFLLTDEVFATAFHAMGRQPANAQFAWYVGLGLTAWLAWIGGTIIGLVAGSGLTAQFPQVDQILRFALVALFFSLALLSVKRPMLRALLIASVMTLLFLVYFGATPAILAGTVSAWLCYVPGDQAAAASDGGAQHKDRDGEPHGTD
ncbi:MAG: AzlC family ABC transporter permease [Advenella sp.]|uniref:Azaleucine resistance protein AzlC n=1 Tax=Advenella kashmirensis TaxID=310575 RepID=A0A356LKY4_9BURK|nr:azaleucine resistance protein AzlC [Advenella kashmirensis]